MNGKRASRVLDALEALGFERLAADIRITRDLWTSYAEDAIAAVAEEVLCDATRLAADEHYPGSSGAARTLNR